MTLTEIINKEPYFKVTNCLDVEDCSYAIKEVHKIEKIYGSSKSLDKIFERLYNKKQRLLKA